MSHERPTHVDGPPASAVVLGAVLRPLAFWSSVLIPLAYVPLLVMGIEGQRLWLFVALLAVHAACLVAGHGHTPRFFARAPPGND